MNKAKKEVKKKAIKQADKKSGDIYSSHIYWVKQFVFRAIIRIFMKNNPDLAMKDGSFPKAGPDMPAKYNREAIRTEKQVVKTQLNNYKKKKKSEPKKSFFSKFKGLM